MRDDRSGHQQQLKPTNQCKYIMIVTEMKSLERIFGDINSPTVGSAGSQNAISVSRRNSLHCIAVEVEAGEEIGNHWLWQQKGAKIAKFLAVILVCGIAAFL